MRREPDHRGILYTLVFFAIVALLYWLGGGGLSCSVMVDRWGGC
jgi:hypothetical protein